MAIGKEKKIKQLQEKLAATEAEMEKQFQEKLAVVEAEIENLKKSLEAATDVSRSLASQFLYLCLSWLKHLEKAKGGGGWRAWGRMRKEWFNFCEEVFPASREEIRQALKIIKTKLGLK